MLRGNVSRFSYSTPPFLPTPSSCLWHATPIMPASWPGGAGHVSRCRGSEGRGQETASHVHSAALVAPFSPCPRLFFLLTSLTQCSSYSYPPPSGFYPYLFAVLPVTHLRLLVRPPHSNPALTLLTIVHRFLSLLSLCFTLSIDLPHFSSLLSTYISHHHVFFFSVLLHPCLPSLVPSITLTTPHFGTLKTTT